MGTYRLSAWGKKCETVQMIYKLESTNLPRMNEISCLLSLRSSQRSVGLVRGWALKDSSLSAPACPRHRNGSKSLLMPINLKSHGFQQSRICGQPKRPKTTPAPLDCASMRISKVIGCSVRDRRTGKMHDKEVLDLPSRLAPPWLYSLTGCPQSVCTAPGLTELWHASRRQPPPSNPNHSAHGRSGGQ